MLKLPRLYPKFKIDIEYNLPFPNRPFLDGHLKKPYPYPTEKDNPAGQTFTVEKG
jgi:hypothetical protein